MTLSNFNSGSAVGDRYATPTLPINNTVVVATSNVPSFIENRWQDHPEVALCLSTNGKAESVLVDWYDYGLVIGPTNYSITNFAFIPYFVQAVEPGFYAVWFTAK